MAQLLELQIEINYFRETNTAQINYNTKFTVKRSKKDKRENSHKFINYTQK